MTIDRRTREPLAPPRRPDAARLGCLIVGIAFLLSIAAPIPSRAESRCMTRILADVPAEEAPEQIKSKSNGEFGPVTQIKVNRETGRMLYCAENSYCYNSNAFEFITPCRLKIDKEGGFGNYFWYFTR